MVSFQAGGKDEIVASSCLCSSCVPQMKRTDAMP